MSYMNKLFKYKKPYDVLKSNELFYYAMKENCIYQYENCDDYKRILDEKGFNPKRDLNSYNDISKIPFIPTLYFKHHELTSMNKKRMIIKASSSGTSGKKSLLGFNFTSLFRGFHMIRRMGKYHNIWSIKPTHYIIFGYEPNKKNQTAISKSAYGFTYMAPALSRTYALRYRNGEYVLDLDNIKEKLIKFSKQSHPVRTNGFPAYTYFLLKQMQDEGLKVKLPKGSIIAIGGGWKQFYAQRVDKQDFYSLVEEVLGIDDKHIIEFFSAVEHPILYTDCKYHHFHVPVYSRLIIRNVDSLEPVEIGKIGLVNFLTPMINSMPLLSVMTDDLGILHQEKCPCGEESPWFEIIGRVGINDIVTCAAGAEEVLKK